MPEPDTRSVVGASGDLGLQSFVYKFESGSSVKYLQCGEKIVQRSMHKETHVRQ